MFSPDETVGRTHNWGAVYVALALMGLTVLIPMFMPTSLSLPEFWTHVWGIGMFVGYGASAISALSHRKGNTTRRLAWLEAAGSWLGNAGLVVYVSTLVYMVLFELALGRVPQAIGYVALMIIMVSRAIRLQRYVKRQERVRDITRIAFRNGINK